MLVVEHPHGDAGDAGLSRFEVRVALGERPDGGELLVAEVIEQRCEPDAEEDDIAGRKGEHQSLALRRGVERQLGIRFEGVVVQLREEKSPGGTIRRGQVA